MAFLSKDIYSNRSRRSWLAGIGMASAIALMTPGAACAQNISVNIEAQPLDQSLLALAEKTGVQIAFASDIVAGINAPALSGSTTLEAALDKLLRGTNLTYSRESGNLVVVRRQSTFSNTSLSGNTAPDGESLIVVTGSRIVGVPPASPVTVIDREEIEKRGLRSTEDIVRFLPQNFAGTNTGGTIDGNSVRFADGAATVDLRGLGEGATLILVNGKRISGSPAESGAYTDIANIPFAAIERVEVLTDGASAIYGSDAVAGVINFILKKDYSGFEANVRLEHSSSGGHRLSVDQSLGLGWGSGNLTATFSYTKTEPSNLFDAGLGINNDFRSRGGRFFDGAAQPVVISSFRGSTLPGAPPPGSLFAVLPSGNGANIDVNAIQYVSRAENAARNGNFFLLSPLRARGPYSLTPAQDQYSSYVNIDQNITDKLELNVGGLFSLLDSRSESVAHVVGGSVVPTTNFYNNFGFDVLTEGYGLYAETEAGLIDRPFSETTNTRLSIFGSLEWEMPFGDWTATASFTMGNDRNKGRTSLIEANNPLVLQALASSNSVDALNLFGDGTLQRANLNDLVTVRSNGSRQGEQSQYSLAFNGTLISLPGGDAKLAFGGDIRADSIDYDDFDFNPIAFSNPGLADFVPEAENQAIYGELFLPLVGADMNVPLINELSVRAAGRYDNYDIEGPFDGAANPLSSRSFDAFVPKIGVVWRPVQDLKLRATWGEAFQVPTLPELFEPRDASFPFPLFFFDPLNPASNGGPGFVPVPAIFGGNADLQPQRSETYTIGADFRPSFVPGFTASVTYSNTKFSDRIGTVADVFNLFGLDPFPLANSDLFPDIVQRDANGVLTAFDFARPVNLTSRTSESIDFDVRYVFDSSVGEFTLGVIGVHTLDLSDLVRPGVPETQLAGTELGPSKWVLRPFVDWSNGDWSANLTINHSSSYTFSDVDSPSRDVNGYTTVNLRIGHDLGDTGWRFSAGVNNLFNQDFPFVDQQGGVDSSRVDFRRRVFFLDMTKAFTIR